MANPVLNEKLLHSGLELENESVMTINGTILKTCVLGLLMAITFAYNWGLILSGFMDKAIMLSKIGLWAGLVLCLVICFAPKNKFLMITTPLYAMCEGLVLGFISAFANAAFPGVASQAAIGTIFALFGMLILYRTKLVQNTGMFQKVIFSSTLAVCGIYLLQIILSLFHMSIPAIFSNSPVGIGFSILVVAIASFNLIIDFDSIEKCSGCVDKHYEWYFGFSLLVTIIWMYLEILKLLMKLQSRRH